MIKKLLLLSSTVLLLLAPSLAQAAGHQVNLTCTASPTLGVTYTFSRATVSGGPYSPVSLSPVSACAFTDTIVTAGTTYYYVAQAYDGVLFSVNSNQATAIIPPVPAPPTSLTAIAK